MQSKAKRFPLWKLLVIFGLLVVVAIGLLRHFGTKQGRICENLKPGLSQRELISALGTPINQDFVEGDILLRLTFEPNFAAAGLISAWVDQRNEKVVRLRCWEDGADTWKID